MIKKLLLFLVCSLLILAPAGYADSLGQVQLHHQYLIINEVLILVT